MKNFLRPFVLSVVYCLISIVSSAQFTLTVTNGYGGGTYNAGDTVNIYSKEFPLTDVFDKWTGDVQFLEYADEWHTTVIMPAQNVSFAGHTRTIGSFAINHESIRGRDTLKEVYSYFPQNFKGVIFCFHGTGGQASNWTTLFDYVQFLHDAVADTFAFIITESEETTKHADLNGNGKTNQWNYVPYDSTNVDFANIQTLIDTFKQRGITNASTNYFSVGMSNGGAFSAMCATYFNWTAAVSYCAQAGNLLASITTVPIQWCMAKYDNHPNVGAAGNAEALANHNTLISRGVCSRYFLFDHSPVYPQRFMRSPTVTQTKSNNLFLELQNNNLLSADKYLLYATDTIGARIQSSPSSYPQYLTLSVTDKLFMATQVDVMYSAHQFYCDYDKRTLEFFNYQCSAPTAIQDIRHEMLDIRLSPNPTSENLNVSVPGEFVGEELSIYDLSGRRIMMSEVRSQKTEVNTSLFAPGIYFVKIGTQTQKFIKQ